MSSSIYLITPPFTQLNTPYPATAYLKGFLNTRQIDSYQSDLGIEVILEIFSSKGLKNIFEICPKQNTDRWELLSEIAKRIITLQDEYIKTIDVTVSFLQGQLPTISYMISSRNFLPEASRFAQIEDLDWAFGHMGIHDKAKYLSTMYLEDISDLIKEFVDEHFGFSRYAEKLGRSANSFDAIYDSLQKSRSFVDNILISILEKKLRTIAPTIVAISVPFPGNLFAAFRCAQYIKSAFPHIKIAMGGGFPNTELRSLKESKVFEFFDFITLDDGEAPIENLIRFVRGEIKEHELIRTYLLKHNEVIYFNNPSCKDYKQGQVGTPDYSGLLLDKYIQAIEMVNPMHSLWSNGRWNKLTMAHGCYWAKCTFCDVSLDYIKNYEPLTATILCDRMEEIIKQTGERGFHFVDEAAPPALMRSLAIEIIKRKLIVSWWTNIRFEKTFTKELCFLLKQSGCIGVSGGLEVASDRLLRLINKGVTVSQVALVNRNFTEAGIMVHAYLMYGFPSQTVQETIDSLEMVRQMFKAGILKSAFWHQFTMTAHSPIGLAPEKYGVKKAGDVTVTFADNDVEHIDDTGIDHTDYADGLKKALFNFMHQIGIDQPLHFWFEQKIPKTTIDATYIEQIITTEESPTYQLTSKIIFLGALPRTEIISKSKKGNRWEVLSVCFSTKKSDIIIKLDKNKGEWFVNWLRRLSNFDNSIYTMRDVKESYELEGFEDFELFWDNKPVNQLYKVGLYVY